MYTSDLRLRKNLTQLLIVHPTIWIKTMLLLARPFIRWAIIRNMYLYTFNDNNNWCLRSGQCHNVFPVTPVLHTLKYKKFSCLVPSSTVRWTCYQPSVTWSNSSSWMTHTYHSLWLSESCDVCIGCHGIDGNQLVSVVMTSQWCHDGRHMLWIHQQAKANPRVMTDPRVMVTDLRVVMTRMWWQHHQWQVIVRHYTELLVKWCSSSVGIVDCKNFVTSVLSVTFIIISLLSGDIFQQVVYITVAKIPRL